MDLSSQRSKSFKALSVAQPIRKDIEQTLNQLQQQKRKFLACEREETLLKEEAERKRKELNKLKAQVPETQLDDKRTSQTNLKLRNTDRTYQKTVGNINRLKDQIQTARKRVTKLKQYNDKLFEDQNDLTNQIDNLVEKIVDKQKSNQNLKADIVNYREINLKNLSEFRKSHTNLNKSNFKDQNERRKYAVSTKTFLGEEMKMSRMVHYDQISDLLKKSGIVTNEGKADILADSVKIAKQRVNVMIHKNKQKIKIAQNYKKFGEGLQNMFTIMKQYKGRDDIDYLAEQFVKKQKQIQKLGQYIGKLEHRIVMSKKSLDKKEIIQNQLQRQLTTKNTHNESEQNYKDMSAMVKEDIEQLRKQSLIMNDWLKKIGQSLSPLAGDNDFSRGNAINVVGKIEQKLGINRSHGNERKQQSPTKQQSAPVFQADDYQKYGELMSYDKMKQYADQFIKTKKA